MNRKSVMSAGAAAALLLGAGCGSSKSSSTTTAAAPTTTAAASTSAASGGKSAYGTASPASSASSTGVVVTAKHAKLGTILAAGPKKLTVYLFEGDKNGASACTGACASAWPPVTTGAAATASGAAVSADLATITRSDGTKQVTYNGHPLYFFVQDKDSGDAYGQGVKAFGSDWYVLKPSGVKVDNS